MQQYNDEKAFLCLCISAQLFIKKIILTLAAFRAPLTKQEKRLGQFPKILADRKKWPKVALTKKAATA